MGGPKTVPLSPPGPSRFDWLSAGQFGFSVAAGLGLFGSFLVSGAVLSLGTPAVTESQLLSSWMFAWGLALAGILMIPSAVYSGRRLFGSEKADLRKWQAYLRLAWFFPLVVLLGWLVETGPAWARVLLPLIHILANGAGVLWLLGLAWGRRPGGSSQRLWGGFASGLALVPPVTFLIEILILLGIGLTWLIILQFQPGLKEEMIQLVNRLGQSTVSPQILERSLSRILALPGVAASGLIYIAVLIPLVEEILKPLGVWLLLGRRLSPGEGFGLGAAAGAGYALFENLTIGAAAEGWTLVTVSRLGTAAVHIFASGLAGWGLSSAVTEKRYFRLAGAFLAGIGLHGVWNGLNILAALGDFPRLQQGLTPFGYYFGEYAPAGLVILGLGSLGGILLASSRLGGDIMAGSKIESEVGWKSSAS